MMKQVMKRAWELAKEGVTKFGGKVREYFATSLSFAWKEIKTMSNFNAESVMAIGAKGHVVYVAIPTTNEVTVLNAVNIVKKSEKEVTNKSNGVTYNVFAIEADATEAPFTVIANGKNHSLKVDIVTRKVLAN